jgi:hypothetical protein
VPGGWRNFVLFTKNYYVGQIKEDEMGRACSAHGDKTNVYKISVRNAEGKRQLGTRTLISEDNIKMDLTENEMEGGVDVHLDRDWEV